MPKTSGVRVIYVTACCAPSPIGSPPDEGFHRPMAGATLVLSGPRISITFDIMYVITMREKRHDGIREDLIRAAVKLLADEGAAALRVRSVAEAAGLSTMAIYSRFGDMGGLLNAVYTRGFEVLENEMAPVEKTHGGLEEIERLALAYRQFAVSNPGLFALMFERPLPDFDPATELRSAALQATFGKLVAAVGAAQGAGLLAPADPLRLSYILWVTTHGAVALELTHTLRSPLPGWFIDSAEVGKAVLLEALRTTLAGLRAGSQ